MAVRPIDNDIISLFSDIFRFILPNVNPNNKDDLAPGELGINYDSGTFYFKDPTTLQIKTPNSSEVLKFMEDRYDYEKNELQADKIAGLRIYTQVTQIPGITSADSASLDTIIANMTYPGVLYTQVEHDDYKTFGFPDRSGILHVIKINEQNIVCRFYNTIGTMGYTGQYNGDARQFMYWIRDEDTMYNYGVSTGDMYNQQVTLSCDEIEDLTTVLVKVNTDVQAEALWTIGDKPAGRLYDIDFNIFENNFIPQDSINMFMWDDVAKHWLILDLYKTIGAQAIYVVTKRVSETVTAHIQNVAGLLVRATDLETRATNVEDRATSLEDRATKSENDIKTLSGDITSAAGNLDSKVNLIQRTLNDKIDSTKTELNNTISSTKAELEQKISDGDAANTAELNTEVANLTTKIETADTELDQKIDSVKSELETNISTNVGTINTLITTTKNELEGSIDSVNNTLDTKIDTEVEKLTESLNDTNSNMATEFEKAYDAIDLTTQTLTTKITTAESTLNANIDSTKTLLESSIEDTNADIDALETKVDANKTATDTLIDDMKTELTANLETAKTALQDSINSNVTTLSNTITSTKNELETKINTEITDLNTELETKISTADTELDNKITAAKTELSNSIAAVSDQVNQITIPVLSEQPAETTNGQLYFLRL